MSIETTGPRTKSGEIPRPSRNAGAQLSLPLGIDSTDEDALRAAWKRCGLRIPYHVALRTRPIAICLSCLADAMRKRAGADCPGAAGKRGPNRGSRKQYA